MRKIIFLFLIASLVTIIWFHKGLILGAGEAGITFYRLPNEFTIIEHAWVGKGLGNPTGIVTSLYPVFYAFSFLQKIGAQTFIIQAGLFFILLASGFLGIFLLVKRFTHNSSIAFLSALFYNFNLMSLTLVWNRFQYPFMFFYACIPLALYIFIKGLHEKKIFFVFLLNILLICFVFAFASVPLLLVFWFILFFYCLFFIATHFRKEQIVWTFYYLAASFILFLLLNAWWILQLVLSLFASTYILQQSYGTSGDYTTFSILSQNLGQLEYLIRLMHKDFFVWMMDVWGDIYQTPFFIFLSFLPLCFIFGSIWIKKKPKEYYFFFFLAILSIFFAKGENSPFGGIFSFLFLHFKILEGFRNPFEKIGLVIPLGYAPLFGFGVYYFYQFLRQKSKQIAMTTTVLIVIAVCGILVWQMWTGWVFTSNEVPANDPHIGDYIKVPGYYKSANDWLNNQSGDFRTIAFPLQGEGVKFSWEYGYNGVDPSSSLFDKQFLSFCTGLEYLCPLTSQLQSQVVNHPDTFWKVLPPLNVNYLMVRDDINSSLSFMQNPNDFHNLLFHETNNISFIKQFNKLYFFKLKDSLTSTKIFGSSGGIFYNEPNSQSFIKASSYADYNLGDIYMTDPNQKKMSYELNHAKQIILKARFFDQNNTSISPDNAEQSLPYVRFLPDSPFYFISRWKEKLSRFMAGSNFYREATIESDKRLVEIARLVRNKKYALAQMILQDYSNNLQSFLQNPQMVSDEINTQDLLRQQFVLAATINVIKNAKQETKQYKKDQMILLDIFKKLRLTTLYPVDLNSFSSYITNIPEDGTYQFLLETPNWETYYQSSQMQIHIDGTTSQNVFIDPTKDNQVILNQYLTKGAHQIDLSIPQEKNIVTNDQSDHIFDTKDKVKDFYFPLTQFDPYSSYVIAFDYRLEKGNSPSFFVAHDTDIIKKGKRLSNNSMSYQNDRYDTQTKWHHYTETLTPNSSAHTATFVFEIKPLCIKGTSYALNSKCKVNTLIDSYNPETKIQIKNIQITKRFNNNLFLTEKKSLQQTLQKPDLIYKKINPAIYEVFVKNANTPFFLSFLESFHPLWNAYYVDKNGQKTIVDKNDHFLINSFANAWFIKKTGTYHILVEFEPEIALQISKVTSFFSVLIVLVIVIIFFSRKYYENKH